MSRWRSSVRARRRASLSACSPPSLLASLLAATHAASAASTAASGSVVLGLFGGAFVVIVFSSCLCRRLRITGCVLGTGEGAGRDAAVRGSLPAPRSSPLVNVLLMWPPTPTSLKVLLLIRSVAFCAGAFSAGPGPRSSYRFPDGSGGLVPVWCQPAARSSTLEIRNPRRSRGFVQRARQDSNL
jgi:hypothetical protein